MVELPRMEGAGFDFELSKRNTHLQSKGLQAREPTKTGTTICGMVFKDGVVLGADTRSTAGTIVADKNCEKIHPITDNIYCCGAGTAADCDKVTSMVASSMKLHQYATGRPARVVTVKTLLSQHLFKYQGYVGAALILGGVDLHGGHIYSVHPHGSVDCLAFDAMGSGSLNAISVLETGYRDDMSREEAMDLVAKAIRFGVFNDLGSGSNVDLCIITKDGVDMKRNYEYLQKQLFERRFPYDFAANPSTVTKEKKLVSLKDVIVTEEDPDAMEIA